MATAIQFLRSSVPGLRPDPTQLLDGMPMVNTHVSEPGLYFKLSDNTIGKMGGAAVGSAAPNANPAGVTGNSLGELWLDTSNTPDALLKVWDGNIWVTAGNSLANVDPGEIVILGQNGLEGHYDFRYDSANGIFTSAGDNNLGGGCNTTLTVNQTADFLCGATFSGNVVFQGGLTLPDPLQVDGRLNVNGNTVLGDSLPSACADTLTVNATSTFNCPATFGGAVAINNTLDVVGDFTLTGATTATGDLTLTGTSTLTGNVGITGDLTLTGALDVTGDFTLTGDTLLTGDLGVTGDVILGDTGQCSTHTITFNNKVLSECDILVGGTLPTSPNVSIGNDGTVEALFFKGDGSQITNLPVSGTSFLGSIDCTVDPAPAGAVAGDFYMNTGAGSIVATWTPINGQAIVPGQFVYFDASNDWNLSAAPSGQAYVTVNTDQTVSGAKTFGAKTILAETEVTTTLKVTGITTVEADILPDADGTANIGSPTQRFANLYTQDLHFSNEGTTGNSVDGTTGDWTLQEGNENLYFINNKTGVKFRVVMEAV